MFSYEKYYEAVVKYIQENNLEHFKIFVATDEQGFINFIKTKFDCVVYQDIVRSQNNIPLFSCSKRSLSEWGRLLN